MEEDYFELPELIYLEDFGGNIQEYLEAVYKIFETDFILKRPVFEGKRLGLKKHPLVEGKAYTFYHFTHSGTDENNREPDFRRMERISFPKAMISNSRHSYLKVWRKKLSGNRNRILIYHEEEAYLVVLDDRGEFILPWTAYPIEYPNMRRRLLKEYQEYKKAEAAK